MKYALDTEFWERGHRYPIELISIGIKAEDGRGLYLINQEFDWKRVPKDDWLVKNVKPNLILPGQVSGIATYPQMKQALLKFVGADPTPEFWGYFADYDWSLFCQIFGKMIDLPTGWPQFCWDVNQERISLGLPRHALPVQSTTEHNALNDAAWTMQCVETVLVYKRKMLDRLGNGGV